MTIKDATQRQADFAALYEAHYAAVVAYCRRRSDESTAEDVAHETFLVAWRRLEQVPADTQPWLLGVARRELANARRGQERRQALLDRLAQVDPPASLAGGEADPAQISPALRTALEKLPPAGLEALLLIAWEGLTPAGAAKALGCSQTTLRARLHRARRALARALDTAERDAKDHRASAPKATLGQGC